MKREIHAPPPKTTKTLPMNDNPPLQTQLIQREILANLKTEITQKIVSDENALQERLRRLREKLENAESPELEKKYREKIFDIEQILLSK